MKKLVLTMVALVAMATTSFAQYSDFEQMCSKVIDDFFSSSSAPSVSFDLSSVSFDLPSVSYSVPSTVNFNTTTVSGYTRSNGTYVESHVRTMPNNTNWDNFSTKGNSNPYTGSTGHRARDYSRDAYNYGAIETRIGASEMMPLILIYSVKQYKSCPILRFVILTSIVFS